MYQQTRQAMKGTPIDRWISKQQSLLSQIVKSFQAYQATIVYAEQVLSAAEQISTNRRNRLADETAAILIFLHTN